MSSSRCNWLRRENLENSWYERFLEENENKPENISIQKRSVKCLRSEYISSRFQVFFKKAMLINFTKFTEKQSYRSLFFDTILDLKFTKRLADYRWSTISYFCKLSLLRCVDLSHKISLTSALALGYSLMINYKIFRTNIVNHCKFESVKSNLST